MLKVSQETVDGIHAYLADVVQDTSEKTSNRLKAAGMLLDRVAPKLRQVSVEMTQPVTFNFPSIHQVAKQVLEIEAEKAKKLLDEENLLVKPAPFDQDNEED